MPKHLLLIMLCLASNSNAHEAFISITGKLVDSKSKEPIPYASVYIKGKSIGTTTNEDGRFQFHVPSGFAKDTLVVSVIGYDPFKSVAGRMGGQERLIE